MFTDEYQKTLHAGSMSCRKILSALLCLSVLLQKNTIRASVPFRTVPFSLRIESSEYRRTIKVRVCFRSRSLRLGQL